MIHLKLFTLFILSAVLLSACAVGPDFHAPRGPCAQRYTEIPLPRQTVSTQTPGGESQVYVCEDIPAAWWTLFRSPALNRLICRGIANSPTLAAAKAALRQAQENVNVQIGTLLVPNVGGQFTGTRQRFSDDSIGLEGVNSLFTLFNTTVNVSYSPDIFGGSRRQIEAFSALAESQQFELEAAYLTLTANIVTTAVTEASLQGQIQATHDLIKIEKDLLRIVKTQFELGGISGVDVLTQETQLAQTQALLPPLEKRLLETRTSLSVLVGSLPCQPGIPYFDLDSLHLPKKLPVTLPSRLVCQRPDVRAAEALLHQASAQVGVATANLFPQFPLTANYGSEAIRISNLFINRNQVWLLSGQLLQPIFQGGALMAQRRAAIDAYDQAFAQYRQTVLQAFKNVADALQATEMDARTLQAQTAAEKSAHELLVLTKQQFYIGATDYLSLLNAQQQYQRAHVIRIQAQAARFADTAALFQALGGGWWNRKCALR
jgi:NodT family efflux transporter outer membrane factor (OMF) lipoprotein